MHGNVATSLEAFKDSDSTYAYQQPTYRRRHQRQVRKLERQPHAVKPTC